MKTTNMNYTIGELAAASGNGSGQMVEMISSTLDAGQGVLESDLKIINQTIKEMISTARVFGPYRNKQKKISAFGSARTKEGTPAYEIAKEFGRLAVAHQFAIITGAGPGVMQACNEGAGCKNSFGVGIQLPFEQKANGFVDGAERFINYKYFFSRKVAFVKEASAIVVFSGGVGTLDELFEAITLIQTGKCDLMPIILVDVPGGTFWSRLIDFMREEQLANGYISESDFALFKRVESAEDAIAEIKQFYKRYDSMRYVDGQLVIRLKNQLPIRKVVDLKNQFADILVPGGSINISSVLSGEADELNKLSLPRLRVDFNRRDFGRLRSFIDALNNL